MTASPADLRAGVLMLLRRERFLVVSFLTRAGFVAFGEAVWGRMASWPFLVLPFA